METENKTQFKLVDVYATIRSISNEIDSMDRFEWINNGGCGFFAGFLMRELQEVGVPAKFVNIGGPHFEDEQDVIDAVMHPDRTSSVSHIVVKMLETPEEGRPYCDAEGFHSKEWLSNEYWGRMVEFTMDAQDYLDNALGEHKRDQWNSRYSWRNNAILSNIIKKHFNELKNKYSEAGQLQEHGQVRETASI